MDTPWIRKLIEDNSVDLDEMINRKIGAQIIKPTIIYSRSVLSCIEKYEVSSMAHITGGGFQENIIRAIPEGCQAIIDKNYGACLLSFSGFKIRLASIPMKCSRTFNCGIGYALIVKADVKNSVIKHFQDENLEAYEIGSIRSGEKSVIINHG